MPHPRDVRFTFSSTAAINFDVVSFELTEELCKLYCLTVDLVSTSATADFAQLLDQPATLTIWQGEQPVRHVHGLISRFEQGKTGFRRTAYRAVIEPQLARATLQSDWRIFQQRSVPQILEQLATERRWGACTQHLTETHLPREYCVQAGDLDWDFYQRLAAEEGLLTIFQHSEGGHQLIQADHIASFGVIEGEPLMYEANPGGDQAQPALHSFTYREQVRSAQQAQRDYTFTHPRYNLEQHEQARQLEHQSPDYERYDYPGRYKHDDAGKPFTQTRLQGLRGDARTAEVTGDDARLVPGLAFDLTGHPRDDLNIGWRAVAIHHIGRQYTAMEEEAVDSQVGTHYSFTATLIPDNVEWQAPPRPKPCIEGPQIATVVGPSGEEIYCDEHGRVRLQFPWDRQGQDDDRSSCWVRVTHNWAGAGWGHVALPRIGQEVLVGFVQGDPDQPLIIGRSYHAINRAPYKLPDFKALSPIRSKELHGERHNELRLDDTTGQISAALMSDHAASALTLGYLTHPRPGGGVPRGEGFELRTDAHGVLRAGGGLLLTTQPRPRAAEHHTDLPETAEQLDTARQHHATFASEARDHLAQESGDQDEVADALKAQHSAIRGSGGNPSANHYPELAEPHLVLHSPAGIASSTPQSTHIASGEHLALSSGGHTSLAIGKRLLISASRGVRTFVQSLGWRLVAASGDIDIRALKDNINLLAKLKVTVTAERITLSAKEEIVIQAAGSSTTYNAGGITHATSGLYTAHATDFFYKGAKSQAAAFPEEPKAGKGNLELFQQYANGHAFKGAEYQVTDALGKVIKGKLDGNGFATVAGLAAGPAKVVLGNDPVDAWTDDSFPGPFEQLQITDADSLNKTLPKPLQKRLKDALTDFPSTPAPTKFPLPRTGPSDLSKTLSTMTQSQTATELLHTSSEKLR
ncbi:type VI secretion system tip protein VgrG [Pseudomonas sp. SWRI81]|uniref:type VI secretion system Vgr family protein n=1 Tax=Pseudomonas sp. SWRI81 TaxID=2745505 RepID=UPI00164414D3|nr:type VI secretion system Vgr family protein [Pseudomonas sp. SWRI81]MBC3270218.1 type VI secretion system tip protein VgrG [Pseudomonas sp. SWRI81]